MTIPPFDVFPYEQRSQGIRELIDDIDKVLPLQTWQKQALYLILRHGNMATDAYLPVEQR